MIIPNKGIEQFHKDLKKLDEEIEMIGKNCVLLVLYADRSALCVMLSAYADRNTQFCTRSVSDLLQIYNDQYNDS